MDCAAELYVPTTWTVVCSHNPYFVAFLSITTSLLTIMKHVAEGLLAIQR